MIARRVSPLTVLAWLALVAASLLAAMSTARNAEPGRQAATVKEIAR